MIRYNFTLSPPAINNPPDDILGFVIDEYRHNSNSLSIKGYGLYTKNRAGNYFYVGAISGNANNGVGMIDTGGEGLILNTATMSMYMDFHCNVPGIRHLEKGDTCILGIKNLYLHWLSSDGSNFNLLDINTYNDRPKLIFYGDIQAESLSSQSLILGNYRIEVVDGELQVTSI